MLDEAVEVFDQERAGREGARGRGCLGGKADEELSFRTTVAVYAVVLGRARTLS
jgi:hypothetical protein